MLHEHVHHAVLQNLEFTDWRSELLALTRVFDCHLMRDAHGANRFCTRRCDCFVNDLLNEWQRFAFRTNQRILANRNILEIDF